MKSENMRDSNSGAAKAPAPQQASDPKKNGYDALVKQQLHDSKATKKV